MFTYSGSLSGESACWGHIHGALVEEHRPAGHIGLSKQFSALHMLMGTCRGGGVGGAAQLYRRCRMHSKQLAVLMRH